VYNMDGFFVAKLKKYSNWKAKNDAEDANEEDKKPKEGKDNLGQNHQEKGAPKTQKGNKRKREGSNKIHKTSTPSKVAKGENDNPSSGKTTEKTETSTKTLETQELEKTQKLEKPEKVPQTEKATQTEKEAKPVKHQKAKKLASGKSSKRSSKSLTSKIIK